MVLIYYSIVLDLTIIYEPMFIIFSQALCVNIMIYMKKDEEKQQIVKCCSKLLLIKFYNSIKFVSQLIYHTHVNRLSMKFLMMREFIKLLFAFHLLLLLLI